MKITFNQHIPSGRYKEFFTEGSEKRIYGASDYYPTEKEPILDWRGLRKKVSDDMFETISEHFEGIKMAQNKLLFTDPLIFTVDTAYNVGGLTRVREIERYEVKKFWSTQTIIRTATEPLSCSIYGNVDFEKHPKDIGQVKQLLEDLVSLDYACDLLTTDEESAKLKLQQARLNRTSVNVSQKNEWSLL